MSREQKFVKTTLILSIGSFLPKAATFVTLPILTGYLTQEEYGTYDLIILLASLVLPTVTLQLQTAAFRFLIQSRKDAEKCSEIITSIVAFSLPLSVLTMLIVGVLLPAEFDGIRLWVCLFLIIEYIYHCIGQIARGLGKNLDFSLCAILASVNKIIFAILLVEWLKKGLPGALTSLTISYIFSLTVLSLRIGLHRYIRLRSFSVPEIKRMLAYSWPMVPNNLSMWIMRMSDRFLISIFMGLSANAVYAVANKIPSLLSLAQNVFSMAWTESASTTVNDRDADDYYSRMFTTMLHVLAGITAMVFAATPIFFGLLIRGNYDSAYPHIPILVVATFYSSIAVYIGGIYVANMRTANIGITTIVSAAINFAINILFIQKIGIYAASISTAVSYLVLMIYRIINVQSFQTIRFNYREIILINVAVLFLAVLSSFRTLMLQVITFVLGTLFAVCLNMELIRQILKIAAGWLKRKRGIKTR